MEAPLVSRCRWYLLLLLVTCLPGLLGSPAAVEARTGGRELQQAGVSCPAQIPACMLRRCTTRILDSKETYVCLRCQKGYIPVKGSDGKSVVQCGECCAVVSHMAGVRHGSSVVLHAARISTLLVLGLHRPRHNVSPADSHQPNLHCVLDRDPV